MIWPFLFSFCLFLLFSFSCGEKIEPGTTEEPPRVIKGIPVGAARMVDQPILYEAVGTVKAGISSRLGSKLLGTIKDIRVREGDEVRQGDTLVIIDQRQVNAELDRAVASLSEAQKDFAAVISSRDAARAEERLAYATYERYLNLRREDSVSKQEFEEVEARYYQAEAAFQRSGAMVEAARARVEQAEAALATAQVISKDALITAPYDGIITEKLVDKGDLARPGMPLLTLETTQGFCVDVILPETYVGHIRPGQKVLIHVPALKTGALEGNVCTLVPSADPRSRSFIVKITLATDKTVRSGMFARVQIPMGQTIKLLIPQMAVVNRGQLTGLYLLNPDNTVHFRLIRLGKRSGDQVEVLSGLKEGDRYVIQTPPTLRDGDKVEVSS